MGKTDTYNAYELLVVLDKLEIISYEEVLRSLVDTIRDRSGS
jgi:hypothetical protein